MKVDENKNKKLPRKLRKIIVEKKRRERIDTALKQLKDMLFGGSELQNDYMRMEKADILENVVKHLQNQQSTNVKAAHHGACEAQYRLGYVQCVREVTRIMDHLCGSNSSISQSLSHYLNTKVAHMTTSAFMKPERLHHHTHAQSHAPRTADDVRTYPECTSASGISPEARVPPLHHSPNSAFHRVPESRQKSPSSLDNISIAVYQYNHYNNCKNEKYRANAESNINIRPVIQMDSPAGCAEGACNTPQSGLPRVQSNINIRPVVKLETQSKADSSYGEKSDSDRLDKNRNEQVNNPFVKIDSDMWRPW